MHLGCLTSENLTDFIFTNGLIVFPPSGWSFRSAVVERLRRIQLAFYLRSKWSPEDEVLQVLWSFKFHPFITCPKCWFVTKKQQHQQKNVAVSDFFCVSAQFQSRPSNFIQQIFNRSAARCNQSESLIKQLCFDLLVGWESRAECFSPTLLLWS